MASFNIYSDSSCDLPRELVDQYNIFIVPYYVSFDAVNYLKEGVDISNEILYKTLRTKKIFPKTSLPPISDYMDAFKLSLDQGKDILCVCLTSKFSGSYQCALNAKNELQKDYPDRVITIVDSILASIAQGQLVVEAAKLRDAGKDMAEVCNTIDQMKTRTHVCITVDSLDYLHQGGRIGKVSAFAGSLLNIKPVIVLKEGELIPHSKVRGRKKALAEVIKTALKDVGDNREDYSFAVIHSDCYDEADKFLNGLKNDYGLTFEYPICELGVTIGTHIGPTVLGLSYLKRR